MRSVDEYRQILSLWEAGENKKSISRITGIPRKTVVDCIYRYGSLETLENVLATSQGLRLLSEDGARLRLINAPASVHKAYAYLLGVYLGDGMIVKNRRRCVLRLFLDAKYPRIIAGCQNAIQIVLPNHSVNIVGRAGCVELVARYKHWPALIPQHGAGPKHKRDITLTGWQTEIVDAYPLELFRGLYHSDGSRSRNVVNGTDYPRYLFANESPGIRAIFCRACDLLGLRWTIANRRNVCISRRADVAFLDHAVGPKS